VTRHDRTITILILCNIAHDSQLSTLIPASCAATFALLDAPVSRNFLFRAYVTVIAGQGTSPSGVGG
jgi:hypothetical protein